MSNEDGNGRVQDSGAENFAGMNLALVRESDRDYMLFYDLVVSVQGEKDDRFLFGMGFGLEERENVFRGPDLGAGFLD